MPQAIGAVVWAVMGAGAAISTSAILASMVISIGLTVISSLMARKNVPKGPDNQYKAPTTNAYRANMQTIRAADATQKII